MRTPPEWEGFLFEDPSKLCHEQLQSRQAPLPFKSFGLGNGHGFRPAAHLDSVEYYQCSRAIFTYFTMDIHSRSNRLQGRFQLRLHWPPNLLNGRDGKPYDSQSGSL